MMELHLIVANIVIGGTCSFTPTAAGSFPFHCNVHADMAGTLTVSN